MEIIRTLGIDWTLFVQMGLFIIAFGASVTLVFEPYMKILNERRKNTVGSHGEVQHLVSQTDQISVKYQAHVQHVNDRIRDIFDRARMDANHRHDEVVSAAKVSAEAQLKEGVGQIHRDLVEAQKSLEKEVPVIGAMVVNKLLGKGV